MTIFYLKEDRQDYKLLGASIGWLLFHLIHETKTDTYNLEQETLEYKLNKVLQAARGQDFSELNEAISNLPRNSKACSYEDFKYLIEKARPKPNETHVFIDDWDGSSIPYGRIHTTKKTIPSELNMEED